MSMSKIDLIFEHSNVFDKTMSSDKSELESQTQWIMRRLIISIKRIYNKDQIVEKLRLDGEIKTYI